MLADNDDVAAWFLRLVLPEEGQGLYVAGIKSSDKQKGMRQKFVRTIEELRSTIEETDRDGHAVYHACAVFKDNSGRKQSNASGAKSLWLDLDVGRDTPYKTSQEALDALADFCRTARLPPPLVVASGSGFHVYWPLVRTLDPATWNRYATGLKSLCRQFGLDADPARTADIASVLRPPGTHNRKHATAAPVTIDPKFFAIEPYALDHFAALLEQADAAPSRRKNLADLGFPPYSASRRTRRRSIVANLLALDLHDGKGGDASLIAERCAQMRALRDEKGRLPEPRWYAALGVLAFCWNGDQFGHEWSSGYPGYTPEETQGRLDRARTLTGATTCQYFHGLDHETCERCPHWGTDKFTSPIALGMTRESERVASGTTPAVGRLIVTWEKTQGGAIKPKSYINTRLALAQLGVTFQHDVFHNRKIVRGDVSENLGPELSDATCRGLRDAIIKSFEFDPGLENVQQAAERACEENRFDPVCDHLDALHWDGTPRLDRWVSTYLGAEDTALNRAIGRKTLIAMVRRAREPGCKFDYALVLEGPQGAGKSTALRILAGEDNFTDQPILHLDTRSQQEALEGAWICELSELAGLRRTEVETIKNFLSKTEDNARPAYGRYYRDQPRRCIFVGTTNSDEYLKDDTGNRRFWSVRIGVIDLEALERDRDQLLAEAAAAEAKGESLGLPAEFYGAAAVQQDQRVIKDPWEDLLAGVTGKTINVDGVNVQERVSTSDLLTLHLRLAPDKITDLAAKRLRIVMRRLGWQGPKKMKFGSTALSGYWRPAGVVT
jgi:Virulence-associated protein E